MPPPIAEVQQWIADRDFPPERPLLDVSQAVPSYPPPDALIEYLRDRIRLAYTHLYTDILGRQRLRRALADDIGLVYEAEISPQEVAITAGCNQAFCLCIDALAGPGDEVILPVPFYFNHDMWLRMRHIVPRYLASPQSDLLPQAAAAAALINERTRAIVLVSPNNPTGAIYPAELLAEFSLLARANNLALIVDETYRDFRTEAEPPHRLWDLADWQESFIHLYSFSKAFAITGHRVGAIVAGKSLLAEISKIMDCAIICAPHLGQEAAIFGLSELTAWRAGNAQRMARRMATLQRCFDDLNTDWQLVSSGAYFAYLQHPFDESAVSLAKRLADQANVLCVPGSSFGEGQDRYLRFAFANLDESQVPDLVDRLALV